MSGHNKPGNPDESRKNSFATGSILGRLGEAKKHKASCKKYKPYILKYKALILK